ncbi:MAG TPA: TetR/AcrR family transcriptional regulator [Rudaea sp.]|jgi:TetR/AcrR family transcriptional repressor of mexJK operon|uniref:TetR/AcrR family transcriptional regulator n=1 Tax=Rudaea sp. TaxID=2136325 RepID=UPI002F941643
MNIAIAKTCGPGRPKDLGKRAAILQAAKRLFITQGFEGTSMDAIANAAGVSKLTVYSHYQDKERLFTAAVEQVCHEQMPTEIFNADLKGPIRRQLLTIARAFFALITSAEALAVHRTIVANARQSPRLAQMFWEAGPRRTQLGLESFLREEVAAGKLEIADFHRAATQFFCLLKGECHARMEFGCGEAMTQREIDEHLNATVDLFLRAYAPR